MNTVELKADIEKDDLSAVFKAERNEHLQYIDKYVTASKVTGTSHHRSQAFTDYHYGWAHKILGAFGAVAELDFSADCAGCAFLTKNGVPQERHSEIKEAWLSLRKSEINFHRFREVSEYLKQTNAEDTRMNRTKIALKVWDARGDAFLDLDGRWPGFDLASIHDKKTEAEFTDADIKADLVAVVPATANVSAVQNTSLPQPECAVDIDKRDQRSEFDEALVSQFGEIVEQSCVNNIGRWDKKTANQFRQSVNLFIGILTESNVSKSSEIRQKHVAQLRTLYTQISPNYGRAI